MDARPGGPPPGDPPDEPRGPRHDPPADGPDAAGGSEPPGSPDDAGRSGPAGRQDPAGRSDPPDRSDPADPDAAFAAIVAGFGRSVDGPVPPWPVEEDVDAEQPPARGSSAPPPLGPGSTADPPSARPPSAPPPSAPRPGRRRTDPPPRDAGLPGWVEPEAVADGGHYVPPPPPPPPRLRPRTLAASAAILLGILLLFAPSLLDVAPGSGSSLLGLLLTAGGAGALVYWVRDAPGPDDDPDDGAVV